MIFHLEEKDARPDQLIRLSQQEYNVPLGAKAVIGCYLASKIESGNFNFPK